MGGILERQLIDRRWAAEGSGDRTEPEVSVSVVGRENRTEQKEWYRPRLWKPDETKGE